MKTRIMTGFVMAVVFVLALFFGQYFYIMPILLAVLGCIGAHEVLNMEGAADKEKKQIAFMLYSTGIISPFIMYSKYLILVVFFLYLAMFVAYVFSKENELLFFSSRLTLSVLLNLSIFSLSYFYNQSMYYLVFFILLSSGTDIFAYFGGYFFGKNKLIPWVSPNKTIEGAIGGVLGALGLSVLGQLLAVHVFKMPIPENISMFNQPVLWGALIFVLSLVSQFGDLFFSKVKRYFDMKDFGHLFPGHGGVLDRLDGVVFVTVTTLFLSLIF